MHLSDFPGGRVDKNLPASAGNRSCIPNPGSFHMLQSSWAPESQLPKPERPGPASHPSWARGLELPKPEHPGPCESPLLSPRAGATEAWVPQALGATTEPGGWGYYSLSAPGPVSHNWAQGLELLKPTRQSLCSAAGNITAATKTQCNQINNKQ